MRFVLLLGEEYNVGVEYKIGIMETTIMISMRCLGTATKLAQYGHTGNRMVYLQW